MRAARARVHGGMGGGPAPAKSGGRWRSCLEGLTTARRCAVAARSLCGGGGGECVAVAVAAVAVSVAELASWRLALCGLASWLLSGVAA